MISTLIWVSDAGCPAAAGRFDAGPARAGKSVRAAGLWSADYRRDHATDK
ncbi:hypothetical protein I6G56_24530 [Burkholderia humptydooensis]|uniref:Uncharacterized protein n=1 Tax=Burkholderia humptydooensis TaxID=430531 RepID=A0A7T2U8E7_9BURK|nr:MULTISPECIES: hypothetical protein [Burkholderia]QPS47582.1 hypothetical protein I6G56_24530 [Burkholderia humptydooensis]